MSENKDADAGEQRTFEDKVQGAQDRIEATFRRLGKGSWARILRMARKPSRQEFKQTSIICGIGLFVLGFIGFVILVVMDNWVPGFFSWLGIGF
ncbi:MAG: protein translocase SEC61 complex subunit gamma [Euryarchaeota archaeon]|nr:protein translocase SEC61 complex subunit gamma [Euryarchaeota archaeon]|tara:strand:- start:221 stop:502 length:282 start_codon:yes stop_codon:yes gene_type:complete